MQARERLLVSAAVAVLVLVWGTTWAVIRVGLEGIPPFTGVGIRFLIAGALLYVIGQVLRVPVQTGRRLTRLWVIETVFSFGISYGVVYWAEQWVPSGLASVLFSTFPLFVALLAHLWLPKEPLRAVNGLGIILGMAGVAVIFSDELSLFNPQVVLAAAVFLISPASAALSHVLVKRWGQGIHPINLVAVPMLATGLVMLLIGVVTEADRELVLDAKAVGAVLYLAIPGSALTFTLYYWVLERIAATRLSLITFGIPVVAVVVGATLLDEPFTLRTALGALLVLGGVALAMRR